MFEKSLCRNDFLRCVKLRLPTIVTAPWQVSSRFSLLARFVEAFGAIAHRKRKLAGIGENLARLLHAAIAKRGSFCLFFCRVFLASTSLWLRI